MQDAPREGFRLSPQQKYLWTLQQSASDQPYRVIGSLLIEGEVDGATLKERVAKVAGRHEILRTTFARPPGIRTPFQVVSEDLRFSWSEADLSDLHSAEQQNQIEQFFAEAKKQSLDFEHGPLLCVRCLKLADNQHLLIVMLPALCGDRTTFRNLACEIGADYESEQQSIQYADFAEWQNELLSSKDKTAAQAGAFWKQQQELATKPALVLPFEKRLQEWAAFEPESVEFDIGDHLAGKLETLAQRYQTSISVVLFACWQALLWRLTDESDFVVWTFNDGRKLEDLSSAMGLYARYVPIFCPGGDRTFAEYLHHSQHEFVQAGEWQEYFDPGAAQDHTPHKDIAFEFQALAQNKDVALSFSVSREFVCTRPFKIKLQVLSNRTSLLSTVEYDSKVFDRDSVDRIVRYYKRLLANVIQRPDAAIGAMSIMDEDEQRRLLSDFNETNTAYPDRCIHELFEEQASKTPDSPAVVCDNKVLTYGELDRRANQLARVLQKRGVGPETTVSLCMSRSVEAIIGLLAILKAGGAYVPLNPEHPKARLENQLAQSQANICLVNDRHVGPFASDVDVIYLDLDLSLFDDETDTSLQTTTTSENLVYVIFTSGSTGVPKGVAVRHRNLVNYTHYILDRLEIKTPLNFATVSTITADLGNTCIFPSLVSGGCLHILDDETALEGNLLAQYIFDNSIDVLKIVPSHVKALLASTDKNFLPAKYLLLGGESLSWELTKRLSRFEHTCKIINHYGPTETTVGSLTFDVDEEFNSPNSLTVPIGRPIANTRIYVLDKYLMPVPQGVVGELFIGGAGVADGYRNEPAETAIRFLPDPFSSTPGARFYRTGDLARQLHDGNIEFIGRADRQVKTRGYRVELGEIEKTIEEQPGVVQAVVVVRGENDETQQLVAYLTVSGTKPPRHDDIRLALTQALPGYMVPAAFVFLESFPLTPNGKLNRAALPAPDQSRPELRRVFVQPRTPSEKEIAAIWASVLKLDEVGIHDDFFELGGHSLLATQVVARVRKAFQFDLPLRSIFESPTIALLAHRIDKATEAEMSELLSALETLSDEEAQKVLAMEKAKHSREK